MLKLTTDKHEASRGLSATAVLLVFLTSASLFVLMLLSMYFIYFLLFV